MLLNRQDKKVKKVISLLLLLVIALPLESTAEIIVVPPLVGDWIYQGGPPPSARTPTEQAQADYFTSLFPSSPGCPNTFIEYINDWDLWQLNDTAFRSPGGQLSNRFEIRNYIIHQFLQTNTGCIDRTTIELIIQEAIRESSILCPTGAGPVFVDDSTNPSIFECIANTASQPENAKSNGPKQCLIANPVNPRNGNKYQQENDIAANDTELKFTRHYNSFGQAEYGLGKGWSSIYRQSLTVSPQSELTILNNEDGQSLRFQCPILSFGGRCTKDPDVIIELEKTDIGFILTTENNAKEIYDLEGKLLSITFLSGEDLTLHYNNVTSLLETVTDNYGRALSFTYDANNRLESVADPDGEIYIYSYDANNNLVQVNYPDDTPGNLNDNPTKQYEYNNLNFPNHLTSILDENGNGFANFEYDLQGRAIVSEHIGGVERIELSYPTALTTVVTDALGASNSYTYETLYGVANTIGVSGEQCASGCANEGQAQTYDVNGFLASRTDFEGNTTNFTNNVRGLQESRTEAVGTPQARTITTEWHPTFRLPTKITEPGKETVLTYDGQGRLLSRTERELP